MQNLSPLWLERVGMDKNRQKNKLQKQNLRTQKKQDFLKIQNECYLCGKVLNTHIEYLPKTHFVVERAQCHSCMTVVRVKNHSLQ